MMRLFICVLIGCLFPAASRAGNRSLLVANSSSPEIQNARADAQHLSRMRDLDMLRSSIREGELVAVPASTPYYYLHDIPADYRFCRPWTKLFLEKLSRRYYEKFKQPLRVTSLVRTVASQRSLAQRNENAAQAFGASRSSHLTGATVDISKHDMSPQAQSWMRDVLYALKQQEYVYAIEEFAQPTFHVMVYRNYPESLKPATAKE